MQGVPGSKFVSRVVLVLATLALARPLCHAQTDTLVLNEQDRDKTVPVLLHQAIALQLPGNPSTGYAWVWSSTNGSSVSITGSPTYTPNPGGGVGGGGTYLFPLLAIAPGKTTLSLAYEKPWDPSSLADTFTVTLSVTDEPSTPRLSIVTRGKEISLSWPMEGSVGYSLEGTSHLSDGWAALNALPLIVGSNYQVTLHASGSGLFFRLRR